MDKTKALYPIRTICDMTGVNPVTLRAWERRYGLVQPHRTPKGHRLYSQDDVHLIHKVVALLEQGIPVSQVRGYLAQNKSATTEGDNFQAIDYWGNASQEMLNAIIRFDPDRLESTYNEALALYPVGIVTQYLLTPLLKKLGERWTQVDAGIAEEHFFGTYMRNKLGARLHHLSTRPQNGPVLVSACLPGEFHELGLLLFSIAAIEQGFKVILLGANMPMQKLTFAVERSRAAAIVLSGAVHPENKTFIDDLSALVENSSVPVFIGGNAALESSDVIRRAGAHPLGMSIPHALKLIHKRVKKHSTT